MILISGLRLPVGAGEGELRRAAAQALRLRETDFDSLALARQSIDARRKNDVHLVCSVKVKVPDEEKVLGRRLPGVARLEERPYELPALRRTSTLPPVVAGMGPAGLFAALTLARAGLKPIVLERGRDVDRRAADVERFWSGGALSPVSNVQFGEGGAGTFSDGKLNTGTHDPRLRHVLEIFVSHGAPADILWSAAPHIGTDLLRGVVKSMRAELLARGGQARFEHQLTGLRAREGQLVEVTVASPEGAYTLPCDALVLAPGHSARDTFQMLQDAGVPLERKSFAVGVRIEHRQEAIDRAQHGEVWDRLPAVGYKLACHLPNGRSAFTFCVCPGGQVVAAASGPGQVVTNGMSLRARGGENCNGALLVGINPEDFGGEDTLAGVRFQEVWEQAAFQLGGEDFHAPAQLAGDFLAGISSSGPRSVRPTYRPGVTWGTLTGALPAYVLDTLRDAIPLFGKKLCGFDHSDAVLTGVETRSSSPVRILRGENLQSSDPRGLYPCGEGAGYAGGIVSAAVDGIRVAERIVGGA